MLPQLVSVWFQVLLTPLIGVLFIVQSPYFSLSVVGKYLALEGGPPSFTQSSTSSVLLWYANIEFKLSYTGLSPSMVGLSRPFYLPSLDLCRRPQPQRASSLVWALPFSLAATYGVSVDLLSCRYLDVSVPCVRFTWPMHSAMDDAIWLPSDAGLPHSEIPGLTDTRLLPRAYRSLSRPSSPLDA